MAEEVAAPAAPAAPADPAPAATPGASATPAESGTPAQNTAESAPAAKPGDGKTPVTPDPAEKRSQSRFDRKIDKLHRRAAEAEARAAFFEKQANERAAQQADPNAPKLESFKDIEEYAAAREKYASEKALREHQTKQQTEFHKQAQAKLVSDWEARVDRASEKYEDFDSVVGELQPTSPWATAIMEAENGDDIAYHLGQNIEEAKRIAQLPPRQQVREIGKLEAKLLAAPPKVQKPSQAPAPVKPLTGTTHAGKFDLTDTSDLARWMKERNKQAHSKR